MRLSFAPIAIVLSLSTLVGCGHSSPVAKLAAPQVTAVRADAASIVASNTSRLTPVTEAEADAAQALDPAQLNLDDPRELQTAPLAAPPSYKVDDHTPYDVKVAATGAHTATITWHTVVATRGTLEFGRTWGFAKHGMTDKRADDTLATEHKVVLTDLRRFTTYNFKVTAVTPLGLKFSEKERQLRTKFWALK